MEEQGNEYSSGGEDDQQDEACGVAHQEEGNRHVDQSTG